MNDIFLCNSCLVSFSLGEKKSRGKLCIKFVRLLVVKWKGKEINSTCGHESGQVNSMRKKCVLFKYNATPQRQEPTVAQVSSGLQQPMRLKNVFVQSNLKLNKVRTRF